MSARTLMPKAGETYGRLTVISHGEDLGGATIVDCRCECGGFRRVPLSRLRQGVTKSCGCLRRENAKKLRNYRQGCARRYTLVGVPLTGEQAAWLDKHGAFRSRTILALIAEAMAREEAEA